MADAEDIVDLTGEEDEEGIDLFEYIASSLHSSEGESLADILSNLTKHIENQNKILIKIVSLLTVKKET